MQLRGAREASGKTQFQLAKEIGVSELSYQRYEYNMREPGVGTAIRIARVLNSTVEELFGAATLSTEKEPDGNPAGTPLKKNKPWHKDITKNIKNQEKGWVK